MSWTALASHSTARFAVLLFDQNLRNSQLKWLDETPVMKDRYQNGPKPKHHRRRRRDCRCVHCISSCEGGCEHNSVDQGRPAAEVTSKAFAWINASHGVTEPYSRLWHFAIEDFRRLESELLQIHVDWWRTDLEPQSVRY